MTSLMHRKRSRPSPALIVAVVALVAALAGTAIAGPTATTSVSKKKTKKISKRIAKKQVNKKFPVGNDDLSNPSYWAVVQANGTLVNGNGASTAQRFNAGNYRVEFETDISQCSYQATPRNVNQSLTAHADLDVTNNQRVFVSLRNSPNAVRTDGNFQVAVHC